MEEINFSALDDQKLMQLLIADNLEAWSELIKRHGNLVYNIGFQVLNNSSDTEDAVQNTFVRLKLYSRKFDLSMPLKPWLTQIASGEAIRIYNSKKNLRKKESTRMEPFDYSGNIANPDVSEIASQKEIEMLIKKAIELLPELSRVSITLYYIGGMSQSEIAKELGLSQVSISEKIKVGIEKIKLKLKESGVFASIVISPELLQRSLSMGVCPDELKSNIINKLQSKGNSTLFETIKFKNGQNKISVFTYFTITSAILFFIFTYFYSNKKVELENSFTGTHQIAEKSKMIEYKFEPIIIKKIAPVEMKYVKLNKNKEQSEIMEGNIQLIGGKSKWQVGLNSGKSFVFRDGASSNDKLDGFYIDQYFLEPLVLKGKIKIMTDQTTISIILCSPLKGDTYLDKNKNETEKISITFQNCKIGTINDMSKGIFDLKVYVWNYDEKIMSVAYLNGEKYPLKLFANSIQSNQVVFGIGLLGNGNVEAYDFETSPLPKEWSCQLDPEINKRLNEISPNFYKTINK